MQTRKETKEAFWKLVDAVESGKRKLPNDPPGYWVNDVLVDPPYGIPRKRSRQAILKDIFEGKIGN